MPRPTTALIVDDEAHVRTFLRLVLKEVGIHQAWEAPDGAAALEMTQQHAPDLVLLDVNMPQLGGLEVLAKFHEMGVTTPVVMITAQSAISTVTEAMRLGAAGYILKHAPRDEAIATLQETLEELALAE